MGLTPWGLSRAYIGNGPVWARCSLLRNFSQNFLKSRLLLQKPETVYKPVFLDWYSLEHAHSGRKNAPDGHLRPHHKRSGPAWHGVGLCSSSALAVQCGAASICSVCGHRVHIAMALG